MPDRVSFNIESRGEVDEPMATCALCGERFPLELILGHLAGAHDLDIEIAEWPDGSPVIVDSTLEPADFEAGPGEGEDG